MTVFNDTIYNTYVVTFSFVKYVFELHINALKNSVQFYLIN